MTTQRNLLEMTFLAQTQSGKIPQHKENNTWLMKSKIWNGIPWTNW